VIDAYLILASFLLFNVIAGLVRVLRGPTAPDRMLAAQLFSTTGVAVLILLARAMNMPSLLDVALIFALLAAVAVVAFVMRFLGPASDGR
jgi:multicomponent Na+:H+ antiporter subunit F